MNGFSDRLVSTVDIIFSEVAACSAWVDDSSDGDLGRPLPVDNQLTNRAMSSALWVATWLWVSASKVSIPSYVFGTIAGVSYYSMLVILWPEGELRFGDGKLIRPAFLC